MPCQALGPCRASPTALLPPIWLPPQIAVGYNHSIAVASDGGVWTWGFGGYGRLGHKVQQVRWVRVVRVGGGCVAGMGVLHQGGKRAAGGKRARMQGAGT